MRKLLTLWTTALLLLLALCIFTSGVAVAESHLSAGSSRSTLLIRSIASSPPCAATVGVVEPSAKALPVGPYIVDVNLSTDTPVTGQEVQVTVVPHDPSLRLSGSILAQGGPGNDNTNPLLFPLSPVGGQSGPLQTLIHLPVRGAWQITVCLAGPQQAGKIQEASFLITVAGPGAIPVWLAWVIATAPLLGIAWLVWHQRGYRRKLVAQAQTQT